MGVKKINYISISEYLQLEEKAEQKHEYEKGAILAMSGSTIAHGMLCGNVYNELRRGLKNNTSNCKAFGSEIRIHIQEKDSIVYPDAMVICGKIEESEHAKNAVVNPVLIVEVLSNSTASYDRGDKFYKYRHLLSFKEYLLVNQDRAIIETYFRKDDGAWEISRVAGLEESFSLQSIGLTIKMNDLYQDVLF